MSLDAPATSGRSQALPLRTTPPVLLGRGARLVERNLLAYRQAWLVFVSGLVEPVFYLFAVGVGIGGLVGSVEVAGIGEVPYGVFVAPALLAASSMNGAVLESTFNVFAKLKWGKLYDAMLVTPMQPRDIAVGELTWALMRGGVYALGFLLVAWVTGLVVSPWALLALPASVLIGFGFAGIGLLVTTYLKSWQDFDLVTMALLPLFLFSATFYPIEVYPAALQPIVFLSPLTHGVALVRGLMLGDLGWALLGHAAVFVVLGLVGLRLATRRFAALLVS
ncbi:ABC transporter permease [Egicoccus halophilus]|uniref:Transport permease protein n=1 Tax=Egicoccus halophilus TaxID=1670830 RepID=A0A8J3AEG1_9ACTN|nr:ABC transporter permease [Egicoccus halophilus]GGI06234.1 transport permease protein [Egicoccus halophilus]